MVSLYLCSAGLVVFMINHIMVNRQNDLSPLSLQTTSESPVLFPSFIVPVLELVRVI